MQNKEYSIPEEESVNASEPVATPHAQPFTLAQREILDAVAGIKDEDVRELKKAIALYFAQKADKAMEELWDNGTWNEDTLERLRQTHLRTPYNS